MSVELCANSFCVSFGNVKSDYSEQFKPYFSLWLLPGKDVYFNMSILTLVVYIFIKYFHFVSLCFHYNYFVEANFSLPILETRSSIFIQLLLKWLWCVRIIKDLCFPSPYIMTTYCSQSQIKHVLAPKLLSPCYKRIGSCFTLTAFIELWMYLGSLESTQEARVVLGYCLKQFLRFFCTLQTSRVHP